MKILAIDDQPESQLMLKLVLSGSGHSLIKCQNAAEAQEIAEREQPAVILLDLNLPGFNILEILAKLKASPLTQPARILILSGSTESEDIKAALTAGAEGFLMKPVERSQLMTMLGKS